MFSFFWKKKKPADASPQDDAPEAAAQPAGTAALETRDRPGAEVPPASAEQPDLPRSDAAGSAPERLALPPTPGRLEPAPGAASVAADSQLPSPAPTAASDPAARTGWLGRLRAGLRKTGHGITQVFTGARIDEALYEELEAALLMADAGSAATQYLLDDLRRRVKATGATDPAAVRDLLEDALAELLAPLEAPLVIGERQPTVVMVAGVNGAGKTTTIGKLTRHLANSGCKVLLAAGDTFRAAAREQLAVWADRNTVEIVAQQGGDPASVAFDAVAAGKARGVDVVIVDTAGRLATQLHLMDELKKVRRVIGKAMDGAPHEVLLVVDGNTGQNALAQVEAFDTAIALTGLVVTKLDGSAKGGVVAAIALRSADRVKAGGRPLPVYFIGVGEQLEDLQSFRAREFAHALLES